MAVLLSKILVAACLGLATAIPLAVTYDSGTDALVLEANHDIATSKHVYAAENDLVKRQKGGASGIAAALTGQAEKTPGAESDGPGGPVDTDNPRGSKGGSMDKASLDKMVKKYMDEMMSPDWKKIINSREDFIKKSFEGPGLKDIKNKDKVMQMWLDSQKSEVEKHFEDSIRDMLKHVQGGASASKNIKPNRNMVERQMDNELEKRQKGAVSGSAAPSSDGDSPRVGKNGDRGKNSKDTSGTEKTSPTGSDGPGGPAGTSEPDDMGGPVDTDNKGGQHDEPLTKEKSEEVIAKLKADPSNPVWKQLVDVQKDLVNKLFGGPPASKGKKKKPNKNIAGRQTIDIGKPPGGGRWKNMDEQIEYGLQLLHEKQEAERKKRKSHPSLSTRDLPRGDPRRDAWKKNWWGNTPPYNPNNCKPGHKCYLPKKHDGTTRGDPWKRDPDLPRGDPRRDAWKKTWGNNMPPDHLFKNPNNCKPGHKCYLPKKQDGTSRGDPW